jgi:hemerythrin
LLPQADESKVKPFLASVTHAIGLCGKAFNREVNIMKLMWTDHLSVGIKYFDEDHKHLIRFINELQSAIENVDAEGRIAEDEIEIALIRLENYFQYHCVQEEIFMKKIAYPEIEEHKTHHQFFLSQVEAMSQSFRGSRKPEDAVKLMEFMYDWVTNHINNADKKYGDYLRSCKVSPEAFNQSKSSIAERKHFLSALVPLIKNESNAA